MKKVILTSLALFAGAALVHAQAWLELDSGVLFGITTNTGTFGNPSVPAYPYGSIISGKTLTSTAAPFAFDYAFLYIPTGIGTSQDFQNLTDGNWVQLAVNNGGIPGDALFGTNSGTVGGNFQGQNGFNSLEAIGINGDAFQNGITYSIAIVGWSSNLGSCWNEVSEEYSSNDWSALGNFGYEVNSVDPNPAAPGSPPTTIWGNSTLVLYTVPEPATFTLAGLGGFSMLLFRRKS
jgi:hypothetical protein